MNDPATPNILSPNEVNICGTVYLSCLTVGNVVTVVMQVHDCAGKMVASDPESQGRLYSDKFTIQHTTTQTRFATFTAGQPGCAYNRLITHSLLPLSVLLPLPIYCKTLHLSSINANFSNLFQLPPSMSLALTPSISKPNHLSI